MPWPLHPSLRDTLSLWIKIFYRVWWRVKIDGRFRGVPVTTCNYLPLCLLLLLIYRNTERTVKVYFITLLDMLQRKNIETTRQESVIAAPLHCVQFIAYSNNLIYYTSGHDTDKNIETTRQESVIAAPLHYPSLEQDSFIAAPRLKSYRVQESAKKALHLIATRGQESVMAAPHLNPSHGQELAIASPHHEPCGKYPSMTFTKGIIVVKCVYVLHLSSLARLC